MCIYTFIGRILLIQCKPDITLILNKNGEWVEVSYKYPLPDVKLAFADDEWAFDVLLRHEYILLVVDVVEYLVDVVVHLDATAAGEVGWFHDPHVAVTVDAVLIGYV